MPKGEIILQKGQMYYTEYADEAYQVQSGSVQAFVAQWFEASVKEQQEAGAREILKVFSSRDEERLMIPSLVHTDSDGQSWRICMEALENNTVLAPFPANNISKKNFLRYIGIDTYQQEGGARGGFENCLVSHFRLSQARQAQIIKGAKERREGEGREARRIILDNLRNKTDYSAENDLYRAVRFAAERQGITLVDEGSLLAMLQQEEMTVQAIARASHFICREVTLDLDWFRSDSGVLLAFLPQGEGRDAKGRKDAGPSPIACFPKGDRYCYFNGSTGETAALTPEIAAKLDPKAFALRRALPPKPVSRRDALAFIRKSVHTKEVVRFLILSVIIALLAVLIPKLNQLIYDEYIPMGNYSVLIQVCLVILASMVGNVFISVVKSLLAYRIPARAGYELQEAVFHRIFELPESFFRKYDSAELATRVSSAGGIANKALGIAVVNGFGLIVSIIYLIQMIRYSWKLALVGMLMLLVMGAAVYLLSKITLRPAAEMAELEGKASGKLYQFLGSVDKLRMAGAENRAVLEYIDPISKERKISIRTNRLTAFLSILIDASGTLFSMVLYYMMIKSNLSITMGAFMAFTTSFGALSGNTMDFVRAMVDYNAMKPLIKRLEPILQAAPEDNAGKNVILSLGGGVRVENVSFSYTREQPPVLNQVSMDIAPGEYVAIVGPSGCGKSTLLKLLLGFETPNSGRICYDQTDLASIDKHSLRKRLGVVLQNGKLISGSISDNITITSSGRKDIGKVWKTIEDVGLREDVEAMPMNIHTVLNESGGTISGGQQQRILIARAIYNDPEILFFDEATSALDNITQARVCQSLEKLRITRVVIAHRLSTVRNCDRIIVLDRGRIVEEGNFETLMERRGQFYAMASRQLV